MAAFRRHQACAFQHGQMSRQGRWFQVQGASSLHRGGTAGAALNQKAKDGKPRFVGEGAKGVNGKGLIHSSKLREMRHVDKHPPNPLDHINSSFHEMTVS